LLILDGDADVGKLVSILRYDGLPLDAGFVVNRVLDERSRGRAA